ncbi:hypothetical protein B0E42_08050 [Pseudomonas sp. A25(2017)]|nr:hypothetical protein B0E42_08050 [Pseudomonas sp. A25(2017)]
MKFRPKCRINDETIELAISAEIAFHNPRYRYRRWVAEHPQSPCGSEPARDRGESVGGDVGCADAFASKLAPTGFCVVSRCGEHPQTHVEASLLAIAVHTLSRPSQQRYFTSRNSSIPR